MNNITPKTIRLNCEDDCSIIQVSYFDGDDCVIISHFGSSFYERQEGFFYRLKKRILFAYNILRGKEYQLYDIIVQTEAMRKFLDEIDKEIYNNKKEKNLGRNSED